MDRISAPSLQSKARNPCWFMILGRGLAQKTQAISRCALVPNQELDSFSAQISIAVRRLTLARGALH